MQARVLLELLLRRRARESLIGDYHALGDAAFPDEVGVGGDVQHVAGVAHRADRLPSVQVEGKKHRYVAAPLHPGLPREVPVAPF